MKAQRPKTSRVPGGVLYKEGPKPKRTQRCFRVFVGFLGCLVVLYYVLGVLECLVVFYSVLGCLVVFYGVLG